MFRHREMWSGRAPLPGVASSFDKPGSRQSVFVAYRSRRYQWAHHHRVASQYRLSHNLELRYKTTAWGRPFRLARLVEGEPSA